LRLMEGNIHSKSLFNKIYRCYPAIRIIKIVTSPQPLSRGEGLLTINY
jgi:hypothetical protein